LVDDASSDQTVKLAQEMGLYHEVHSENRGYGANQKTCYRIAIERGADIIIMVHPDYQYTPRLIPAMAGMIASDLYDMVIGSRILGKSAIKGGMPFYKYVSNRFLTMVQNLLLNQKLSEFHSGYRAYSRKVLETLPLMNNSDDYTFDNQVMTQIVYFGFRIGEVSCPTLYHEDMSSINFTRSVKYGLEALRDSFKFIMAKVGWGEYPIFQQQEFHG
ncbi:MAG: glycosyltransferase family 2 protein, partial [bacterium]|nr:glycosyltransferase family 2 protein [bacterium]